MNSAKRGLYLFIGSKNMIETTLLPQQLESLIKSAFEGNFYSQHQLGEYYRDGFCHAVPRDFSDYVDGGEK